MIPVLQLEKVVKCYDKYKAVNEVSFEVPEGCIFGLLGPNGAGKTSLIRIITTIIRADSGQLFLKGEKLNSRHPEKIGYMPEERGLYRKMKVGEHLLYLAQLKGLSRQQAKAAIQHWFEKFDIADWWPKKVEELSKGMQQKIQFIATIIHDPALIILDEPFSGLDPINTNLIKAEIRELQQQGKSIIFSTHRMEQVEEICEQIVLINKGEKVLDGSMAGLKERFKQNLFRIDYQGDLPPDFSSRVQVETQGPNHVLIRLEDAAESNAILSYLLDKGLYVRAFNEILPTLNEIFIQQVQQEFDYA